MSSSTTSRYNKEKKYKIRGIPAGQIVFDDAGYTYPNQRIPMVSNLSFEEQLARMTLYRDQLFEKIDTAYNETVRARVTISRQDLRINYLESALKEAHNQLEFQCKTEDLTCAECSENLCAVKTHPMFPRETPCKNLHNWNETCTPTGCRSHHKTGSFTT